MTPFTFPALGGTGARYQTRENLEAEVRRADAELKAELQTAIDALSGGVLIVGAWDASSGAFPTTRPAGGAIHAGDTWVVSVAGTVDGVAFMALDRLTALGTGGATYAGNWLRAAYSEWIGDVGAALVTPTGGAEDSLANHLAAALDPGARNVTPTDGDVAVLLSSLLTLQPANFASVAAMFASGGKHFYVPAGDYSFAAPFTIPAGAVVVVEDGARFVPSFEPTGVDRQTPLITVGAGAQISYLPLHLPATINTIRIGVQVGSNVSIGRFRATAADPNNNRTEAGDTDKVSGALVVAGAGVRIGMTQIDNFDSCVFFEEASDCVVSQMIHANFARGVSGRKSSDIHILSGRHVGISAADGTTHYTRGSMTPGANAFLFNGMSDCSLANTTIIGTLEHGIRVGDSDGATINNSLKFSAIDIRGAHGCGFKCDDGDAFTIRNITLQGIRTQDIGAGAADNANKCAVAIRNTREFLLNGFQNRAVSEAASGFHGLFVERSNTGLFSDVITTDSAEDGVVIQSGTGRDCNDVIGKGIHSYLSATGVDVWLRPVGTDVLWRGCHFTGITASTVKVDARADGVSPFTTRYSSIEGRAETVTVAANVSADTVDFKNDMRTS